MDESFFQRTLASAKAGNRPALTTLYANYNRMLVRFLRAKAPGAGEDLAQDTWLTMAAKLGKFHGNERAFRIWLLSIARQRAAEHRDAQAQQPTPMEPGALSGMVSDGQVGDASVADAALAELLAGLPPLHAEVLLLRVVGGLTADETAPLVGRSAGAVRVIQHRALRSLAARMARDRVPK